MKVVGETADGRKLFRGVYDFYQSHGMPMATTLNFLWREHDALVDWYGEVLAMREHGMNPARVISRLISEVQDADYPLEMEKGIVAGLKAIEALSQSGEASPSDSVPSEDP